MRRSLLTPTFFATPNDFRRWLARHHEDETELWVGFYKKDSGKPSITWPESVDEALCVGWIDGIRKSLGDDSYMIRFTPRQARSTWSTVNVRRATELLREGRMLPAGRAAFEKRDAKNSGIYAFEQRKNPAFSREQRREFRSHAEAWKFFQSQPAGYRRLVTHWVTSAKREETRARRMRTLIADSARGLRIAQFRPESRKAR